MDLVKPPQAGDDSRELWKVVAEICALINRLADVRVVWSLVRSKLHWTKGSAILEIMGSDGGATVAAAPTLTPWQPYAAPYTGAGDPPADWGLNFMIRVGTIGQGTSVAPASRNAVFTAPPNCADGFFVWLKISLSPTGQITALDYDSGLTLPDALVVVPSANGAYPAVVYDLLFQLTSTATAVDYTSVQQVRATALNLVAVQTVSDVFSSYQVYVTPAT